MSVFWILIYILFVLFVLGVFFWNIIILQKQKAVWKTFAKRNNLTYRKAGFFDASAVEGNYKKHHIGLFSEGRQDESRRGMVRYSTVIELLFSHGMPCQGALGNMAGMRTIEVLNFGPTFHPESDKWNKNHLVTCSDRQFITAYLTPKRLERLNGFLNMKNVTALMVFDREDAFLRVETADPMTDVNKIESFMNKMVALSDDLRLNADEQVKWMPSKLDAAAHPVKEEDA